MGFPNNLLAVIRIPDVGIVPGKVIALAVIGDLHETATWLAYAPARKRDTS